jgi:enoyl-CoA hydratase/carnithine racemase
MHHLADALSFVELDEFDGPLERSAITVGLATRPLDDVSRSLAFSLDLVLTTYEPGCAAEIRVPDVERTATRLMDAVSSAPLAATTLCGLLRATETAAVSDALVVESLAYSMLLAGPEFSRWRAGRAVRPIAQPTAPAVLLARDGDVLQITLNRPERRNALGIAVRDGLVDALDMARLDDSIAAVHLAGTGPAFCTGGDLDEFGSAPDVVTAHLVRLDRSIARRVWAVRDKLAVHLHGACFGAGIEVPSFAGHVVARADTVIALPEVSMGLVPGAGGTVGLPRRIGRWRTAYLALTGAQLDAHTAAQWGLIDEVDGAETAAR